MPRSALLESIITDVKEITKRPDLDGLTSLHVRNATLRAHQRDFYARDLFESGLQFTTLASIQELDYAALIVNWRQLSYLRKYSFGNQGLGGNTGAAGGFFKILTPAQVLNGYYIEKTNVCYLAGRYYQIKSSEAIQYALFGAYLNPIVTDAGYDSWIARNHPFAIVYQAAKQIFRAVGALEQATAQDSFITENDHIVDANNILGEGY